MKDRTELKELVIKKLEVRKQPPQAIEIFKEIRGEHPRLVIKGFRSFVKIINSFPEVKKEGSYPYGYSV